VKLASLVGGIGLANNHREIHAALLAAPRLIRENQHLQCLARILSSRFQHNDDHEDRTGKTVRVCDSGFTELRP
jgi:hypothetical protein